MNDADGAAREGLELTDFQPHEKSDFELSGKGVPGGRLTVQLIETRTLVAGDGIANRRQPFGVVFRGPAEPLLPQQIYRLEHPEVGSHDVFLVPIGRSAQGVDYEAIFT